MTVRDRTLVTGKGEGATDREGGGGGCKSAHMTRLRWGIKCFTLSRVRGGGIILCLEGRGNTFFDNFPILPPPVIKVNQHASLWSYGSNIFKLK